MQIIEHAFIILAPILLVAALALAYWVYQARKTAKRMQLAFEPLPPAADAHDAEYINQRLQELDESPPEFLRRQVG